jgi:3-deoxy-manno-octulosonate cytidylyltransferase (CMP-KDO synthetase)
MKIVGVIPARYGATRLPGKPLIDICGKPMIWRVYQNVKQVSAFDEVCIATDDERIRDVGETFGAKVIMTSRDCSCMIDRIWEVSNIIKADYYIAVNCDEPMLEASVIEKIIPYEEDNSKPVVGGLVREFTNPAQVIDPGNIKIVVGEGGYGIYCSRSPVPYPQKTTRFTYKKYVGVELFNKQALDFYMSHEQTEIEKIEDLGSIRFFDHGIRIHYTQVESNSLSVDTERDLEYVIAAISAKGSIPPPPLVSV